MTAFLRLLRHETRRQRGKLIRASALAAGTAAATVLLLGLSGWFLAAAGAAGLAGPIAARGFNYMLPSAAIRLLAIVRTGARYGERLASHDAAFAILARIRPAIYRAITAAPVAKALSLTAGEATARLVQDVDAVEMAVARRSARAGAVAAILGGAALALLARPVAALALVVLIGLMLAVAFRILARLDAPGRAVQQLQGELRALLAIQLAAAPELRCYAMADAAQARIGQLDSALAEARRQQAMVAGRADAIAAGMAGIAAMLVFVLALPAGAPLAALAALAAATTVDGLAPLLRDRAARSATRAAESRLASLFAEPHTVSVTSSAEPFAATLALPNMATLAPRGTRIAILGPSGTGKTTFVETLIGLRDLPLGDIRLGSHRVDALSPALRRATFGWAPQDAQLLAGTVRDNLRLADPDAEEAALWQALDDACLAAKVRALPHGLDSWIGEDGVRLSGGERRRLSLARAYLAPAPWLLLDEPTEALDAQTEAQVVARLLARLERTGQGLVVVTHRPALLAVCTVRHAVDANAPMVGLAA